MNYCSSRNRNGNSVDYFVVTLATCMLATVILGYCLLAILPKPKISKTKKPNGKKSSTSLVAKNTGSKFASEKKTESTNPKAKLLVRNSKEKVNQAAPKVSDTSFKESGAEEQPESTGGGETDSPESKSVDVEAKIAAPMNTQFEAPGGDSPVGVIVPNGDDDEDGAEAPVEEELPAEIPDEEDESPVVPVVEEDPTEPEVPVETEEPKEYPVRIWTSSTGQQTSMAFVRWDGADHVVLHHVEKNDLFRVPLTRLSADDIEYLESIK